MEGQDARGGKAEAHEEAHTTELLLASGSGAGLGWHESFLLSPLTIYIQHDLARVEGPLAQEVRHDRVDLSPMSTHGRGRSGVLCVMTEGGRERERASGTCLALEELWDAW